MLPAWSLIVIGFPLTYRTTEFLEFLLGRAGLCVCQVTCLWGMDAHMSTQSQSKVVFLRSHPAVFSLFNLLLRHLLTGTWSWLIRLRLDIHQAPEDHQSFFPQCLDTSMTPCPDFYVDFWDRTQPSYLFMCAPWLTPFDTGIHVAQAGLDCLILECLISSAGIRNVHCCAQLHNHIWKCMIDFLFF